MLSASTLDRAAKCLASEHLPHVTRESNQATRGHVLHSFLERCQKESRDAALLWVQTEHPEYLTVCEALDLHRLGTADLAAEVAFAYDPAMGTARELGRGIGRAYEFRDGEIPGTADVVGIKGNHVLIIDYKTGHGRLPRAVDSRQLLFLALAAAKTYHKDYARVAFVVLREDGSAFFDMAEFGPTDLNAIGTAILALQIAIAGATAKDLTEGDHCTYCPAFAACPAKAALAIAFASQSPEQAFGATEITPATAAIAWKRVRQVLELAERVKANIKDFARQTPVDLGDGYVLAERQIEKESFSAEKTKITLGILGYDEAVIGEAVSLVTSKTAVEKAIRSVSPKGTGAENIRKALDAIRQAGGVSTKFESQVREWRKQ